MPWLAWSGQRLLSKIALQTLTTAKFYLLSAEVSLIVYAPYLMVRPPAARELIPALGLVCLMAVTFWVTTEAIRRGPDDDFDLTLAGSASVGVGLRDPLL